MFKKAAGTYMYLAPEGFLLLGFFGWGLVGFFFPPWFSSFLTPPSLLPLPGKHLQI